MNIQEWIEETLGLKEADYEFYREPLVVLLYGTNPFGEKIFSYVEIQLSALSEVTDALKAGRNFAPSDFGRIVGSGTGSPPTALIERVARGHPHSKWYPNPVNSP